MSRSSGKAISLDTKVYNTINHRDKNSYINKTVEDLKIGDFIYDENGKITEVIHLNPIVLEEEYEVTFEDGEKIKSNAEHVWSVYDSSSRELTLKQRNTDYLKNNLYKDSKNAHRFFVPLNNPLEYPKPDYYKIEPYLLGYWLGDGSKDNCELTVNKKDLESLIDNIKDSCKSYYVKQREDHGEKTNNFSVFIDRKKELLEKFPNIKNNDKMTLNKKLRDLEIFNNKHIPEMYFYIPIKDRLSLLQGLCDSDGTIDSKGRCEFCNSNEKLIKDVSKLLDSLGIKYKIYYRTQSVCKKDKSFGESWRIQFYCTKNNPCFRLKRKYNKLLEEVPIKNSKKAIIDIVKTGKKIPMRCITVNNESGCFLCGEHCTVTHNSYLSSPLMMARALLVPNTNTYIMSPSGGQAQETFGKMESLAKKQLASVLGVTDVFLQETVRKNAGIDPFVHDKNSYHVELYNGSTINTLNSVAKNIVGIR